ncbi:endonuclease I family protein [Haploplasma axanthum]|uniref:Extracellular ribonuclease n=1 Tax=Haploplasma axanthum TaxID=29552 RepID=A0A449BCG8_HAPAX|nr:endonuclease [Haploplasma axanthum]VEU80127.1 Extracellular ribonuclease precursor [Haploplasma axanthum]
MKKILYLILLITSSIILVSCGKEPSKTYTIKVYDNNSLINNYFVEHGNSLSKEEFDTLITKDNFKYWSTSKDGVKYTFELPITSDLELYAVYSNNDNGNPIPTPNTDYKISLYINNQIYKEFNMPKNSLLSKSEMNSYYTESNKDQFLHWSTKINGTEFDYTLPLNTNLILYGVFKALPNPDGINVNFDSIKYYQGYGLDGLLGQLLINKLNTRLYDGTNIRNYGSGLNSILTEADTSPVTKKLWTIYDGISSFGNKEHVMPKSWYIGYPGYSKNKGDVHNLRVSKTSTNSARSNYGYFDKNGGWELDKTAKRFYPGDDHKGDTARIYFYMMIMVKDALDFSNNNVKANLNNKGNEYRTVFENDGFMQLLKWHLEDPVDEFEIHRNEVLFGFQGNRNPFIDFPDLVYLVWPEHYKLNN